MSTVKLKVCGMRDRDNILDVAAFRPDFLGFIFYPNSPRYVGTEFQIPDELDASIKRVGVFVNSSLDEMLKLSTQHQLDYIQLHGDENAHLCHALKENDLGIIKVFGVDNQFDFESVKPFEPYVDYFLFDYKGELRGGNGVPFDWNVLEHYNSEVPFFLSGGVGPDNAAHITELTNPGLYAIDVNSGIEDSPGIKNNHKLEVLLSKIKKTAK